jgi:hypothetical protein
MIQEYLNEQFVQTTEDANFEKLKKTCATLAKNISKNKAKIITYSLIAFDPEVPVDNKEITEVKSLIFENWPTFASNSKDTMLTIIRAVILDALKTVSKETSSASLIWFASRNVISYFKLGREKEVLTIFLMEIGNRIEVEASEIYNFSPDNEIDISKVTSSLISPTELATWIEKSIPTGTRNKPKIINETLVNHLSALKINQIQFLKVLSLMQMRTQLLWWKEASYSPLLKATYKNMKEGQLQVLLAYDYSDFIPEMYPISVDYFLIETLKCLSVSADKKTKISDFLKLVEQCNSELKNILPYFTSDDGRISFANFIQGLVHGKYQAKQFKSLVGVADTTELTLAEITLWIFHDLHSIKLSTSK